MDAADSLVAFLFAFLVVAITGMFFLSLRRLTMALSDLQAAVSQNTALTAQLVSLVNTLVQGNVPAATIDQLTSDVNANNSQLQAAITAASPAPAPAPTSGGSSG